MKDATPSRRDSVRDVREASSSDPQDAIPTYATGEAARLLGVSSKQVRRMIASGELPSRRDEEGRHRIPRAALREKLEGPGASDVHREDRSSDRSSSSGVGIEDVHRELQVLAEEMRNLRGELEPLMRLARSTQEEKESALEENSILREECEGLRTALEEERRKASELSAEFEAFRVRWWERGMGSGEEVRST